jgi:hypothetical protein
VLKKSRFLVFAILWSCAQTTAPADETTSENETTSDPAIEIVPLPDSSDANGDSGPSALGGPCTADEDCVPPEGLSPICGINFFGQVTFPGGYCSATCTGLGTCGIDAECLMPVPGVGVCVKHCSSNEECRMAEGYKCDFIPYFDSLGTFCYPSLDNPPDT